MQNLRFADDLLLVATSLYQAKSMLKDLIDAARQFGLEVHPEKTKIMRNGYGKSFTHNSVDIDGRAFEVLPKDGASMYLGRLLTLSKTHDVELKHRLKKAWAKFAVFRNELTNKAYSIYQRLRLLNSVLMPSALYGCTSWVMTATREQALRSTQRKMLRSILGKGRAEGETYLSWIHRTTEEAETLQQRYGFAEWVTEARRRKFKWAGHVSRREDGRWTRKILEWSVLGSRKPGHPCTRWTDSIDEFFSTAVHAGSDQEFWITFATDREAWKTLEADYAARFWGGYY